MGFWWSFLWEQGEQPQWLGLFRTPKKRKKKKIHFCLNYSDNCHPSPCRHKPRGWNALQSWRSRLLESRTKGEGLTGSIYTIQGSHIWFIRKSPVPSVGTGTPHRLRLNGSEQKPPTQTFRCHSCRLLSSGQIMLPSLIQALSPGTFRDWTLQ